MRMSSNTPSRPSDVLPHAFGARAEFSPSLRSNGGVRRSREGVRDRSFDSSRRLRACESGKGGRGMPRRGSPSMLGVENVGRKAVCERKDLGWPQAHTSDGLRHPRLPGSTGHVSHAGAAHMRKPHGGAHVVVRGGPLGRSRTLSCVTAQGAGLALRSAMKKRCRHRPLPVQTGRKTIWCR